MTPVLLEYPCPLVQRANGVRVGAVEHLASVAPEAHEADMTQHLEVLRDRRLTEIEVRDDVADVTFLRREVDEDVATLSFSDGVEDVRCRCSAGHSRGLYSHHGICQHRCQTLVMTCVRVRP
jgi:hypothetical protein